MSDILEEYEVRRLIRSYVDDAPRIGDSINFFAWRWWQEALEENEEAAENGNPRT